MTFCYTSYASLPFMNVLPTGITNFGGDTQVFTVPDYIQNSQAWGMTLNQQALNILNNPQAPLINNWGGVPSTSTGAIGGSTGVTGTTGNPFMDNMIGTLNNISQQQTANRINTVLNQINGMRQKLYTELYKEGITEEEAKKIDEKINQLNEQEQKLNQAIEDAKNGTISQQDLTKISLESEKAIKDMQAEVVLGQNIENQIKNVDDSIEKLDNLASATDLNQVQKDRIAELKSKLEEIKMGLVALKENSEGLTPQQVQEKFQKLSKDYNSVLSQMINIKSTSSTSTSTTSTENEETTPSQEGQGGTESSETVAGKNYSKEGKYLAERFYDAVHQVGTDDEEFDAVCESINGSNVMDVMLAWQDLFGGDGESFMEAFIWDADSSQKSKFGKAIRNALRDKAIELDVMDDCREDFSKINKEMNSWFWISNDVSENYDNIIRRIAEKEGKKYVETIK